MTLQSGRGRRVNGARTGWRHRTGRLEWGNAPVTRPGPRQRIRLGGDTSSHSPGLDQTPDRARTRPGELDTRLITDERNRRGVATSNFTYGLEPDVLVDATKGALAPPDPDPTTKLRVVSSIPRDPMAKCVAGFMTLLDLTTKMWVGSVIQQDLTT